ncbi:PREDICTED: peroxidase 57 [Brassica oleracea var. oleracea]|uniref:Peroxidase n=1 Tax=Brassica oleracea var. oleracea TaxID=109376 RepID=A0A0D3AJL6_BRAOL|nr:PREDICTED: peroxidase 57 [Brassica oleracea var. oleracea]
MMKFSSLLVLFFIFPIAFAQLRVGFYSRSCPQAETIVRNLVRQRFGVDPTVTAALLRMHFHDCFVRGCDASLLIDSTNSEKTAGPNGSVREFGLIDRIKAQLEAACPSTVSCADIITLATRDSVALAGGPSYSIPTGRRDGLVSNNVDVALPGPTISVAGAVSLFTNKGMNVFDAVALLGAHTVGQGNCGLFNDRITNFRGTGRPDPSMDPALVSSLRNTCRNSASAALDQSTPLRFDNQFFKQLRKRRGVMQVDQRLATDRQTRGVVARYANNNAFFKRQFVRAMIKMGAVDVLTGRSGEIRRNCRRFN